MSEHRKDRRLDELANTGYNVAQFAAYTPDGEATYNRMAGVPKNISIDPEVAARLLLERADSELVNIRSFDPRDAKSRPFDFGLGSVDEIVALAHQRMESGLHIILNENIPTTDGGVSGVQIGDVLEFTPFDTPRGVEKPGTVQFPRRMGYQVLETVYGFAPSLEGGPNDRIEWSIHPVPKGVKNEHTIIWETETVDHPPLAAEPSWPNRFSTMLGDKTFGLIVADNIGLAVPRTTVFNRTVAPFSFGRETGTNTPWLRTAPNAQTPGKFTTTKGWVDPYELMAKEDPNGSDIASILHQEGIRALYSGATIMGNDNQLIIDGTKGEGDDFMVGIQATTAIPAEVERKIRETYEYAASQLGPVRFEWVFDGETVWVVQLHKGKSVSYGNVIYPGTDAVSYEMFDTTRGLEELRELIEVVKNDPTRGITLAGDVGITSHFGDILRKSQIPSRLEK